MNSSSLRLCLMSLLLLWVGLGSVSAEEPMLEFRASDQSFSLQTLDDFRDTYNPHAVLSLASPEDVVVVVTKRPAEQTLQKIYDTFPKTLPADYPCLGRVMMTIDGQQSAVFVIDGMFPPEGEPTHQTVLAIAVRNGQEYNFMVHYSLDDEEGGLESAYALLAGVKWLPSKAETP